MILHGENGKGSVAKTLQSLIVQVLMSQLYLAIVEGVRIDGKPMIVGSDLHRILYQVLDRLIPSSMAKLHFESTSSESQSQQLMSQANSEHGLLVYQFLDFFYNIRQRLGVSWPVGEKHPIGS